MNAAIDETNGTDNDKINLTEASKHLGVSRNTTWRIITRHKIKTFENPLDMRETMVRQSDLNRIRTLLRPKKNRRKENGHRAQPRQSKA